MAVNRASKGRVPSNLVQTLQDRISASTKRIREGKVTYIIGNNGTGKSRILADLAEKIREESPARVVACICNSIHDRFKNSDSGKVKYLGMRNARNAVFYSAIDRQLCRLILQSMKNNPKILLQLSNAVDMDFMFSLSVDSINKVSERINRSLTMKRRSAVDQMDLLKPESLKKLERIAISKRNFQRLTIAEISLFLRYLDLNIDVDLSVCKSDGDWIPFKELSSGEQSRTLLFAKVMSAIEEGAVFLIDEPEISLHLHWQMDFHRTLMKLLSGIRRFHVVIATHAPIMISEAAKSDPVSKVNVVAILKQRETVRQLEVGMKATSQKTTIEFHSFSEVASHEQLVLEYFQTAAFHAHEVSVQISDIFLSVLEKTTTKRNAKKKLGEIDRLVGLTDESKSQISAALNFLERKDFLIREMVRS